MNILFRHTFVEELVRALVEVVHEGKSIFSDCDAPCALTEREKEVLIHLSKGTKQTAVASELKISERTVRNHIYAINEKLGTSSVVSAIVKAIELGIIHMNL